MENRKRLAASAQGAVELEVEDKLPFSTAVEIGSGAKSIGSAP